MLSHVKKTAKTVTQQLTKLHKFIKLQHLLIKLLKSFHRNTAVVGKKSTTVDDSLQLVSQLTDRWMCKTYNEAG